VYPVVGDALLPPFLLSLQVGRVSSAGSETRPTIDVVKNETILCSAVSRENFDTKSSPICRVAINIPPCLVATKQSTAKYHKTQHIYSTKTVENGGTASKMKAIFEMLRRVVTLTTVISYRYRIFDNIDVPFRGREHKI